MEQERQYSHTDAMKRVNRMARDCVLPVKELLWSMCDLWDEVMMDRKSKAKDPDVRAAIERLERTGMRVMAPVDVSPYTPRRKTVQPKRGPMIKSKACAHCGRPLTEACLQRHQDSCKLNPEILARDKAELEQRLKAARNGEHSQG